MKEREKAARYQELKREIERLWQCEKVAIIPIIIGDFGAVGSGFRTLTGKLQTENYCDLIERACFLGTAKIIRKVLDT